MPVLWEIKKLCHTPNKEVTGYMAGAGCLHWCHWDSRAQKKLNYKHPKGWAHHEGRLGPGVWSKKLSSWLGWLYMQAHLQEFCMLWEVSCAPWKVDVCPTGNPEMLQLTAQGRQGVLWEIMPGSVMSSGPSLYVMEPHKRNFLDLFTWKEVWAEIQRSTHLLPCQIHQEPGGRCPSILAGSWILSRTTNPEL